MEATDPRHESLWVATSAHTEYPALAGDVEVDVAVLGGGITGITTARLLKAEGKTVALLEARRLVSGVSGYTTAKLTHGHSLVYGSLVSRFGVEGGRVYAESNQAAIERIAGLVEELGIDCDFERAANFVYSESAELAEDLEDEAEAARRCGINATITAATDLPFPVAAAIRVGDQAQFHPRKYLLPVAATIPDDGSHVFELTRARKVRSGEGGCAVETGSGTVRARDVVVATHLPFLDRGLFFAKAHPMMSYAVSAEIADGAAPRGMYISVDRPSRSIRSTPRGEGTRTLVLGGEGHKPGLDSDTERRYAALERTLTERFDAGPVEHRWSAHDYMPVDGVPYIGRLTRHSEHVYVATGFAKWGLTKGTLAAMVLTDLIVGRPNPWASFYDPHRLTPRASTKSFLQENGEVALHFVAGRVKGRASRGELDRLAPGEGRVARIAGRPVAASRDEDGMLRTFSATCTHLGCVVEWNTAERTWDCPCHGSRFGPDGAVLEGPAVDALKPWEHATS
jgi:glycine/D-amino acid oxidase-like deaminating enzyme/nitrite reductase/ring-hydroxylating ferredoxin subunit